MMMPKIAESNGKTSEIAALVPLLWEIGNLKRIKPDAGFHSLAAGYFYTAWQEIAAGGDARATALHLTAQAIAAAQLGAIDAVVLRGAELSEVEIETIQKRAFDLAAGAVERDLRDELRRKLSENFVETNGDCPIFAERLVYQPRSGATKPNAPKLIFDAPENHGEHSLTVAIYGVLLAPFFAADIETVFLTALAHHFHNAYLPDSGFAGEELLGEFLPRIFENLREKCLAELASDLQAKIRPTFALTTHSETPEARAFHAADVLDRVLQMRHHADAAGFLLAYALEEMELVHAGAVQKFHYEILRAAELLK